MQRGFAGRKFINGAKPRSDTQPSKSAERRMFEDLMLPWVNLAPPSMWICEIPFAAPSDIFTRASQSNGVLPIPLFPVENARC